VLDVHGTIPAYASGVLFRTGLGPRVINTDNGGTFQTNHWFDSFAQVHRFQIEAVRGQPAKVTYNSRLVSDGLIEKVKKDGKLNGFTFAAKYDPCMSFFQKLQSVFRPSALEPTPAPNEVSVCVTISANFPGLARDGTPGGPHRKTGVTTIANKTDASILQMLDPESLEPIGLARQTNLHPALKGRASATHAKSDPVTGDVYNYNLDFGRKGTYRVFKVSAETGKTSVLATVSYAPAYLHSLFITENYVVLCIWNSSYVAGGAKVLLDQNLLDSIYYDDKRPAMWYVIDKKPTEEGGKGLVAQYESEPFFCFHTINAFESHNSGDGDVDILADLVAYDSTDVLHRFYFENLLSDSPAAKAWSDPENVAARGSMRRFMLPKINRDPSQRPLKATTCSVGKKDAAPELPTLNPSKVTRKHRYVYGTVDTGKSTLADGLIKHDIELGTSQTWSKHGHTVGEAIFVADPDSDLEDGGILLSVVLDGIEGRSYLLVLSARTMEEIGRADVPGIVGHGFHGLHARSGVDVEGTNALNM